MYIRYRGVNHRKAELYNKFLKKLAFDLDSHLILKGQAERLKEELRELKIKERTLRESKDGAKTELVYQGAMLKELRGGANDDRMDAFCSALEKYRGLLNFYNGVSKELVLTQFTIDAYTAEKKRICKTIAKDEEDLCAQLEQFASLAKNIESELGVDVGSENFLKAIEVTPTGKSVGKLRNVSYINLRMVKEQPQA